MEKTAQAKTVHFCTYKNKTTAGQWRKSREYNTVPELLDAMRAYLASHPITTVQFQTRTVWL